MNTDKYLYNANADFYDFEFYSEGPKGRIVKVARFSILQTKPDVFNFGFGDLDEITGDINDTVVSNNGDGDKILATVAGIIMDFTKKFPMSVILIAGSTPSRNRRYQMGITKYWPEVNNYFEIWGYRDNNWELFQNGVNYQRFIGRRK